MAERAALILLDGEIPEPALVRRAEQRCRAVVCADGGLRHVETLKIAPDFVVGDMDSLPKPLPRRGSPVYWCDFDEDRSDFEKSLDFAAQVGCTRAYVAGVLGGRADHVLVNLAVMQRYAAKMEIVMLDRGLARLLGQGRYALAARGRFSLLASPKAVVTLTGAAYPLKRFTLKPGSRGLGNAAKGKTMLTVHSGLLWLVVDRPVW